MRNLRKDFPILKQTINGHPLIYFDSAATSQKPQQVLNAVMEYYTKYNANIHRGIHTFGEQATTMYEKARATVAEFINAADTKEIVFTKGTTESINLVAASWGAAHIKAGDEILLTELEHHSNLLPWQVLANKVGAKLRFIPVLPDGRLAMEEVPKLISSKTKMVAVIHTSNTLGTHVDVTAITKAAHAVGAKVLVDGAQSVPHEIVDVQKIGCDFFAFSGHKMLGPTGIGVLYINKDLHDAMVSYQVGGGTVFEVDFHEVSWLPIPQKLEAGTPAVAQAIGLGAAIDYLKKNVDFAALERHEAALCTRMIEGLQTFNTVTILGPIEELKRSGHVVSFLIDGMHPHDVAAYLNKYGICVRAGHHCAQPLSKKLSVPASTRASFYCYNTLDEVDFFLDVIKKLHDAMR